MRVRLQHVTRFDYTAHVVEGVMEVRLGPFSDAHQRWDSFALGVTPAASVRSYTDGFGNRAHLVTVAKPHPSLEVVTRAEVTTTLDNPFAPPAKRPRPLGPSDLVDYLSPSPVVPVHETLVEMASPYRPATSDDTFEAVRRLCGVVHDTFTYRRNVTTVATTVDEVLRLRIGVCQDFAHVMLGLCRAIDVPARYVSGYSVAGDRADDASTEAPAPDGDRGQAAQASHAWIEAFTPTHGWRGFDATNNVVAGTSHVKIAVGRDYADVPPTRGSFRGDADQELTVNVESQRLD